MELTWSRITLRLANPFRTAAVTRSDKETLWVKIARDGIKGWGEAAPVNTYDQTLESAESTLAQIQHRLRDASSHLGDDPLNVETITRNLVTDFSDQLATVAAVDAAIHDWIGKRFGISVSKWLGLDPNHIPTTSFTIGIDDPERVVERVRKAVSYPILKIKLGSPQDEQTLAMIRKTAPDKRIRVDANMAWSASEALDKLPKMVAHGVEFVEQPVPRDDLAGLRLLHEAGICPIFADESCVRPADVVALQGCVDGINIKLSKCGGIREAMKMIHLARGFDMKIMLGCMIESSLGIAAAAQLAPLVDYLDLDGHLLLSEDPFTGLGGKRGRLTMGVSPGLGVQQCDPNA